MSPFDRAHTTSLTLIDYASILYRFLSRPKFRSRLVSRPKFRFCFQSGRFGLVYTDTIWCCFILFVRPQVKPSSPRDFFRKTTVDYWEEIVYKPNPFFMHKKLFSKLVNWKAVNRGRKEHVSNILVHQNLTKQTVVTYLQCQFRCAFLYCVFPTIVNSPRHGRQSKLVAGSCDLWVEIWWASVQQPGSVRG